MEELNPDNIDWKVAEYPVMGDSNPVIAKKLGINRSTVWRRLQSPECQAVINAIRNISRDDILYNQKKIKSDYNWDNISFRLINLYNRLLS